MNSRWLFCLLLFAAPASANDSRVTGVGGRWRQLQGEDSSVRMVSETVDIRIRGCGFYTTEANFIFHNDGPAKTVEMGFPEAAWGDVYVAGLRRKSGFTHFQTWVDGAPIRATRRISHFDGMEVAALWVKRVRFRAGQTRRVKVAYRSEFGNSAGYLSTWWIKYDFTGGNWKGKVESSLLTVHFERPGTFLVDKNPEISTQRFVRRGHNFVYQWRNWQAEKSFSFAFASTLRGWVSTHANDFLERQWPVNIDIPGHRADETKVDWQPGGVYRDGKLFVALLDWLSNSAQARKLTRSYNAKTHTMTLQSQGKTASFRAGRDGAFISNGMNGATLFVPAAILGQVFDARFRLDAPSHRLNFLN